MKKTQAESFFYTRIAANAQQIAHQAKFGVFSIRKDGKPYSNTDILANTENDANAIAKRMRELNPNSSFTVLPIAYTRGKVGYR